MKWDVAWYVERCLTCQKVKFEYHRPHSKLLSLDIPMWKWEQIVMDFITKLPWMTRGVNSIWVIVDRLTKSSLFIHIQESISEKKRVDIYIREVVTWHRVPVLVIPDQDVHFTSRFRGNSMS